MVLDGCFRSCLGGGFDRQAARKRFLEAARQGDDHAMAANLACHPDLVRSTTLLQRKTALHLAAEKGHDTVMASILETLLCQASHLEGGSALVKAEGWHGAPLDPESQVSALINAKDADGRTPLIIACGHNHIECARLLLSNGAWREPVDLRGNSALHYASTKGYLGVMLMLLTEFMDELKAEQREQLRLAAAAVPVDLRHISHVAQLLSTLNGSSSRSGRSAAANGGVRAGVEAAVGLVLAPGVTTAARAAGTGEAAVALTAGAEGGSPLPDVRRMADMRNSAGFAPLHYAVWSKQSGAVQVLLQHGADIITRNTRAGIETSIPCPSGSTPLHLAAMRGHIEISRILLKTHYERVMEPMQLAAAVSGQDPDTLARALMELDPRTQTNSMGLMPYKVAHRTGFLSLAALLRPHIPLARLFNEEEHRVRFYGPPALKLLAAEALNRKLLAALDRARAMAQEQDDTAGANNGLMYRAPSGPPAPTSVVAGAAPAAIPGGAAAVALAVSSSSSASLPREPSLLAPVAEDDRENAPPSTLLLVAHAATNTAHVSAAAAMAPSPAAATVPRGDVKPVVGSSGSGGTQPSPASVLHSLSLADTLATAGTHCSVTSAHGAAHLPLLAVATGSSSDSSSASSSAEAGVAAAAAAVGAGVTPFAVAPLGDAGRGTGGSGSDVAVVVSGAGPSKVAAAAVAPAEADDDLPCQAGGVGKLLNGAPPPCPPTLLHADSGASQGSLFKTSSLSPFAVLSLDTGAGIPNLESKGASRAPHNPPPLASFAKLPAQAAAAASESLCSASPAASLHMSSFTAPQVVMDASPCASPGSSGGSSPLPTPPTPPHHSQSQPAQPSLSTHHPHALPGGLEHVLSTGTILLMQVHQQHHHHHDGTAALHAPMGGPPAHARAGSFHHAPMGGPPARACAGSFHHTPRPQSPHGSGSGSTVASTVPLRHHDRTLSGRVPAYLPSAMALPSLLLPPDAASAGPGGQLTTMTSLSPGVVALQHGASVTLVGACVSSHLPGSSLGGPLAPLMALDQLSSVLEDTAVVEGGSAWRSGAGARMGDCLRMGGSGAGGLSAAFDSAEHDCMLDPGLGLAQGPPGSGTHGGSGSAFGVGGEVAGASAQHSLELSNVALTLPAPAGAGGAPPGPVVRNGAGPAMPSGPLSGSATPPAAATSTASAALGVLRSVRRTLSGMRTSLSGQLPPALPPAHLQQQHAPSDGCGVAAGAPLLVLVPAGTHLELGDALALAAGGGSNNPSTHCGGSNVQELGRTPQAQPPPPQVGKAGVEGYRGELSETDTDEDECGVCMEHLALVLVQPCGHSICGPCAQKMCSLNAQRMPHCPFCRALIADYGCNSPLLARRRACYPPAHMPSAGAATQQQQ